ncbi:MAG: lipopolysaccharide heptosyltransferase II [Candidatus Aminicenantes bacterium]|nr:lipopolysaccharide heptosyltransferase II [Candidatus Aminicenantes bacterium]
MKILVRAPNWVGDSILALPAIASLRDNFPGAEVWVASRGWVRDLFPAGDGIAGSLALPDGAGIKTLRRAGRELRACGFDAGLLLTNSFASALLFTLAKIPERWGYAADGRGPLLTKRIRRPAAGPVVHQVQEYLGLISGLGLKPRPPKIDLTLAPAETRAAQRRLRDIGVPSGRPLVVVDPGASYGPAKRWFAERFAATADRLRSRHKAEILLVGSPGETALAEKVAAAMRKRPHVLTGRPTLRELLGLLGRAALVLTNDSGPMHMANALGVPVVGVFGPTDPRRTGPVQPPSAVIKKDAACWPCLYRGCPYDHRCMSAVGVDDVVEACARFL